jgi:transketolase
MALSRQDLPVMDAEKHGIYDGVKHGAYILEQGGESPDLLIVATGSEVWVSINAAAELSKGGIATRVVSMPSWKIFEEQSEAYKASIFPDHLPKLAVEAGAPLGWWKYVGRHGDVIGLERFGASSPGPKVLEELGFGVDNIVKRGSALVERVRKSEATLAGK